jgi:hypothetical protein
MLLSKKKIKTKQQNFKSVKPVERTDQPIQHKTKY